MDKSIEVIMEWNAVQQKWLMKLRRSKVMLQEFFDCSNVRKYFKGLDKGVPQAYELIIRKLLLLFILLLPSFTYAADTTPPDGIILINNNATTTYSRTVEVLIPASDENGVVDMCVSIGSNCTQWEPYSKTKQVTLGETPAWYSICAKVRDVVGWESQVKCVAIQYVY